MDLNGTVKTPLGDVKKKTAMYAGIGGLGLLGVVWYRNKQAASAAASSSSTSTGTDQGTDPQTGYAYGSPEDIAALQQMGASGLGGDYGYPYSGGFPNPGGYNPNPTPTGPGTFTNNAEWAQYAEDYLANTVGGDAATIGNALGKYITGQPVDDTMVSVINQAIAFAGYPPIAGPNGNPPGFNHQATPGGGSGKAHNPVTGLKIIDFGFTSLTIAWDPAANATGYLIQVYDGSKKVTSMNTTATNARIRNLRGNTNYRITVWARPSGAAPNASVTGKTK